MSNLEIKSLGYIKRLPATYAPTFYSKVQDLISEVDNESLVDSVAVLCDGITELNAQLNNNHMVNSVEVVEAFGQLEKLWYGTKHLFKAYSYSTNPSDVVLAKKAMALLNSIYTVPLRRTNIADLMVSLSETIGKAWTKQELQGTFIESWKTQLDNAADNYADLYQRSVVNRASMVYFTDLRDSVFQSFNFFYLNLFTYIGNTGDVQISQLFTELNQLITIFTSIQKAHITRVYNRNHGISTPDIELPMPENPTVENGSDEPTEEADDSNLLSDDDVMNGTE